ncbi:MAG: hypothetical protein HRU19_06205 [Pseudobacteriovorax sp.]|nr:hypothetical protein [Pseudobacteriovorax sp.]
MSEIIYLAEVRKKRKQQYLQKNKSLLDDYIRGYITANSYMSYDVFCNRYLSEMQCQNEMAWDYLDFRDIVGEAIAEVLGDEIWKDIRSQPWFKTQYVSKEELLDRLTSLFIIGAAVSGGEL